MVMMMVMMMMMAADRAALLAAGDRVRLGVLHITNVEGIRLARWRRLADRLGRESRRGSSSRVGLRRVGGKEGRYMPRFFFSVAAVASDCV